MALTDTSDAELLIQFRIPATKESAFTSIIKKYQEKLYWHVRRIVVDHDDANDVLQNVFTLNMVVIISPNINYWINIISCRNENIKL